MIKESLFKGAVVVTNTIRGRLACATRRRALSCVPATFQRRQFTGNTKVLDEKEKGDERIFFKRQEGK